MDPKPLRETLEELHRELENADAVDARSRELLGELQGDITQLLERPHGENGDESHGALLDKLREAARHFEESHPSLTSAVGRVADALSNLGI